MAGYGVDVQRMAVNGRGTDDRGNGENLSCRKNGSGVKVKVKNTWFATTGIKHRSSSSSNIRLHAVI